MPDMDQTTEFVADEPTHRIVGRVPARLDPSDPEWKYVSLRRFLTYLEHSIDEGTRWAVFEPNGEPLWAEVTRTVTDFLYAEWRDGALQGDSAEQAFYVRCDRATMTQNDLDNGRLICEIGVAPVRPAEFVIFRIGQWTASTEPGPDDC
jgi:phage tail sheath protein FI